MVMVTALLPGQYFGLCCLTFVTWMALCLSGCVSQSGVNNETRNGTAVVLSDQADEDDSQMGCIDWEGKPVADGEKYVPNKNDLCMECTCDQRFPILCQAVACSPPTECSNAKLVPGACCEHECLDDFGKNVSFPGNNPKGDYESESDATFSLRMIASTVVSLLLTALVLFIVHKFRQRRVLLALRRMQTRSDDGFTNDEMDNDHYVPDNFLSLECPPYTDPPPPYSPPKPPHILPGEQPPPYEEISLGESVSREQRSGAAQDERNVQSHHVGQSENNSSFRPTHPVATQNPSNEERVSDFPHSYSPQNPVFGVEMEMPRHLTQLPVTSSNQTDILPAYASTDIVFQNATFSTMITPPHGQLDSHDIPSQSHNPVVNESSLTDMACVSHVPSNPGMPTLTAFQRFSSLFKRDRSKWKNRAPQQRPVSECIPPHYATLSRSRNVHSRDPSNVSSSDTSYRNSRRRKATSYHQRLSFTDRMRLSYDSARAAYELAAVSPSTSSNSSNSIEQLQENSVNSSCFPTSTTYCTESAAQPVPHQSIECQGRQMQASHSLDFHSERSPVTCSSTLSPSSSNLTEDHSYHQPHGDIQTVQIHPHSYLLKENRRRNLSTFNSDTPSHRQPYFNHYSPNLSTTNDEDIDDDTSHGACGYIVGNQNSSPIFKGSPVVPCETSEYKLLNTVDRCANSAENGAFPPSPQSSVGQMRRSHSAISQISSFSVCSETGEKKLRDRRMESDAKPLTADCQYPQHHSLSQPKNPPHISKIGHHFPPNRNPPVAAKPFKPASDSTRILPVGRDLSTFGPDLQPATLIVPVSSHLSHIASSSIIKNSADSRKKDIGQQDLTIDVQDHIMPSAAQGAPISPPFVTVQSGKLIPTHPSAGWAVGNSVKHPLGEACQEGNEESKKVRKKRDRDKRASLSLKHKDVSSPSHSVKGEVKTKHDVSGVKKQSRSGSRGLSCHRTDKKRAPNFPPPCSAADKSKPDFEDNSASYGNADVYRSQGYESSFTTPSYPPPSTPFKYVDNLNAIHLSKESREEMKRNHVASSSKVVPEFAAISYNTPSKGLQQQNPVKEPSPQSRKKTSHKRQSAGNRNPHDPSPSQQRMRSKSLTEKQHALKQQDSDVVCADTSFEQVVPGGKWVKSGFGHDLAFDDQLGVIDMGINNSSSHKTGRPLGFTYTPYHVVSNSNRTDGHVFQCVEPAHVSESKNESHVVPLPNRRRSGLSQDLSFINRSEMNPSKRLSKRSSLPAFLALSNPSHKNYSESAMNKNSHVEAQTASKHGKSSRDERDQQDFSEENGHVATSYV